MGRKISIAHVFKKRIMSWAAENRMAWVHLGILLGSLSVFFWRAEIGALLGLSPNLVTRFLSTALQLFGVTTVWWDLRSRLQEESESGYVAKTLVWLRRFPGDRSTVIELKAGVAVSSGLGARISTRRVITPTMSLEAKVDALARNIDDLYSEMASEANRLDQTKAEIATKFKDLETGVKSTRDELAVKIRGLAVGSADLLGAGVFWLAVGILLSLAT
jgi:hypothetical protein